MDVNQWLLTGGGTGAALVLGAAVIKILRSILDSTRAVLEHLEKHFVSNTTYGNDKINALKEEATKNLAINAHIENRAGHHARNAQTAASSALQLAEARFEAYMVNANKSQTEHFELLKEIQKQIRQIDIDLANSGKSKKSEQCPC